MGGYIPSEYLDWLMSRVMESDRVVVCSGQPTTFYNAFWPASWVPETAYTAGSLVRPPTNNGCIYECTIGGSSGVLEPPWGDEQDETFQDNASVTWKTHISYSLAIATLISEDFVITEEAPEKRLTIAGKANVTSHAGGDVAHTAFIRTVDKTLRLVAPAFTSEEGTEVIIKGRVVQIESIYFDTEGPA